MSEQSMNRDLQPVSSQGGCRHHWLIEPPAGPTAQGRCKSCGAVREFVTAGAGLTYREGHNLDWQLHRPGIRPDECVREDVE